MIDANRALNQGNWSLAITTIGLMTTDGQATNEARFVLASAYGGQCGLSFLDFTSAFNGADFSSISFFEFLLEHFVDSDATNQTGCENAEQVYDLITDSSAADAINKVYLAMAKIGVVLNKGNNAAGEGNVWNSAGGFDLCDSGDLSDDDLNEIITGFSRIIVNAASAGLDGAVPSCPGGADCTLTNTADVDASDRTAFRAMLDTSTLPGLDGPGGCGP